MGVPFLHVFDGGLALVPVEPFLPVRSNLHGGKYFDYVSLPRPQTLEQQLASEHLALGGYGDLGRMKQYLNVVKPIGIFAYSQNQREYASLSRAGRESFVVGYFSSDLFYARVIFGPERVKGMFSFLVVPAKG